MNVKSLIADAYKDAQIALESGDEITSQDEQRGLRALNNIVRMINLDKKLLTYITTDNLTLVAGQEVYNINFVDIEAIYFLLGQLRYKIDVKSIQDYYDRASIENVI